MPENIPGYNLLEKSASMVACSRLFYLGMTLPKWDFMEWNQLQRPIPPTTTLWLLNTVRENSRVDYGIE
jgi:hypothetical protein